jgi:hypothetical protein
MRHQLRLRARHLGKAILQQLRRPLVILLAGALQQRLVSRILNQRMLEQIARARRSAALVEQLVNHELTETALQLLFLDPGQRADHVIGKLAPQNRAQLCHFTQQRRPIEPRYQRILQCLRDVQLRQRAREHVGVTGASSTPEPRMALVSSST